MSGRLAGREDWNTSHFATPTTPLMTLAHRASIASIVILGLNGEAAAGRRRCTTARRLLVTLAVCVMRPLPAFAQEADSLALASSSWMLGGTIMMPNVGNSVDGTFSALGLSAGTLRANRVGADLAFVLLPRGLQAGVLAGGARANLALPIGIGGRALLVPSAGLSLLGAVGVGGAGGIRGLNGTMGLIVFDRPISDPGPSYGVRIAIASHRFGNADESGLRMLEVGLVRRAR